MAAYRRVYGFGHLRANCRGAGSAPEPYTLFSSMGLPLPYLYLIMMLVSVNTDAGGRAICAGLAPVCRDHLRGSCRRSSTCKYRHVTLDQYSAELQAHALQRSHSPAATDGCCGKKPRHRLHDDDDVSADEMECCCTTRDQLRILQDENAHLRKRVTDLRLKLTQLRGQRKRRADSDFNTG